MRRKIVAIAVAIPVLYLVLFAVQVGIAYTHAQSYTEQLAGEYDKKQIVQDSANLAGDVDRIFWMLHFPVAKQIAQVAGLDFTPIRDEVSAVIRASSWLAGADAPKR